MSHQYIPLRDTSREDEDGPTDPDLPSRSVHLGYGRIETCRKPEWMTYTALMITLVFTVVNALQFRWTGGWLATPSEGSPDRQPSTYIGLNKLSPSSEESFRTFPILLTQIDRAAKSRVFKDDAKQRLTELGVVWPDTRRFWIENSISSVAQFRTVDYGYENCSVTLSLDASSADDAVMTTIPTVSLPVDIWLHLDVPQITAGTLSYNTLYNRPRATRQFQDTLQPASGQEVKGKWFPCPTGTFFTVEVSCRHNSSSSCHIEFWNDPKHSKFGLSLTQKKAFISDT